MTTCVYALGARPGPVLITIEPVLWRKTLLSRENDLNTGLSSIYSNFRLTTGKIVSITDSSGKINYSWTTVDIGSMVIEVKVDKYFLLNTEGILCYYNKCAVLEQLEPERLFTGVRYTHYSNGKLKSKWHYANGVPLSSYAYRDDVYNTILTATLYKHSKPSLVNTYDEMERLLKQEWLTEKGKSLAQRVLINDAAPAQGLIVPRATGAEPAALKN